MIAQALRVLLIAGLAMAAFVALSLAVIWLGVAARHLWPDPPPPPDCAATWEEAYPTHPLC